MRVHIGPLRGPFLLTAAMLVKSSYALGILSGVLLLSHLNEEEVVDVVVAVDSPMMQVLLKYLVTGPWTVHLHLGHMLSELILLVLSLRGNTSILLGEVGNAALSQFWMIYDRL